jgi:hypothetical protein
MKIGQRLETKFEELSPVKQEEGNFHSNLVSILSFNLEGKTLNILEVKTI